MTLSNNIIFKRKALNLTQTELARLIGVSSAHISRLESGVKVNPTAHILIALSHTLSTSIDALLDQPIYIHTENRLERIEQYLAANGNFKTKGFNQ